MKTQNQTLENSLYILQQPITVISILVLILNDHVLKNASPSWLTGKLSDFAGLFFFPFLITAAFGLVWRKTDINPRRIGGIAFSIVGAVFLLLKTSKDFNLVISNIVGNLFGHPVHYALDPTDVVALIVLLPAWKMWNIHRKTSPRRWAWVLLVVASLASIATSPALPEIEKVMDFVYKDNVVYAADTDKLPQFIAKTDDTGMNWESLYEYDNQELIDKIKLLVVPQEFPVTACDLNNELTCYRIGFSDQVEVSQDAGLHWETAWQIPSERLSFVERKNGGSVQIKTYDLIIVQQKNKSVLLVALGTEGVLRRELPNGEWERIRVGDAFPTPYQEETVGDAFTTTRVEHVFLLSLALLYFAMIIRWHRIRIEGIPQNNAGYVETLVYPATYFIGALIYFSGFSFLYFSGRPQFGIDFYFFLYLPFFSEMLVAIQAGKTVLLKGIILPGVLFFVGLVGNLIISIGIVSILRLLWPSYDAFTSPKWVNQIMDLFIGPIPSALICLIIVWLMLKGHVKLIRERNLGRAFLTHLLVATLIPSGSFFSSNGR